MIDVSWAPTTKSVFLVQIQVEALDRSGLLSDITRVLSEHHVNILSASVQTTNDRLALSRYVFEMGDIVHLDRVLNAVRRIDAVYDVYRVTRPESGRVGIRCLRRPRRTYAPAEFGHRGSLETQPVIG
jgi:GTP pyrophosphokinase